MAHLNAVKNLSQPTEAEAPPPGQKTIVICVRNQNKNLKDQVVMKFQLAHFAAVYGKPFLKTNSQRQFRPTLLNRYLLSRDVTLFE